MHSCLKQYSLIHPASIIISTTIIIVEYYHCSIIIVTIIIIERPILALLLSELQFDFSSIIYLSQRLVLLVYDTPINSFRNNNVRSTEN